MIAVPAYIAVRFAQSLFGFFVHWYLDATRVFWLQTLRSIHFIKERFVPIWDEGAIRFLYAILISAFRYLVYLGIAIASTLLYLAWISLPIYMFVKIFSGLPI